MKLLTHRMAGFNHLQGTFHLNFAELPGLVAIVGDNAQGKTSLALEGPIAGLFGPGVPTKAFPSREGPLARYATSRTAFIEDTWQLLSGTYRVRVNVDGERRTTDALLTQLLEDGTQVPCGDGKSSTFREAVAKLFPSQRSLLAGPFAGQTRRGSFGELGQKERMELFVELANLAYLEERATTCRKCTDVAAGVVAQLRTALAALRQEVDAADPVLVVNRLTEIAALAVSQQQIKDGGEQLLALATADRDRLQVEAQKHAAAAARANGEQQAVARVEERLAQLNPDAAGDAHHAAYKAADNRRDDKVRGINIRRVQAQEAYDKATANRSERIKNNEAVKADADKIKQAQADAAAAQADITRYEQAEQAARGLQDSAREKATEARTQLSAARQAAIDLANVEKRAALIGTVKFGDDCAVAPACPLITDAVEARSRIEALKLAAMPVVELNEAASHWDAEFQRHGAAIVAAQKARTGAAKVLASTKPDTDRAPYLEAADKRIAEYRADQLAADNAHGATLEQLLAEVAAAEDARLAEMRTADEAMAAAHAAHDAQVKALTAELATLRQAAAATAAEAAALAAAPVNLAVATTAVSEAQAAIAVADRQLAQLATEAQHLHKQKQQLERLHARNAELERRLRLAEDKQLAWNALAQRLGRDGLQRLEIDAAGPVVSDIANQLLEVGWGPRFTVAIVTQVATADGKDMKEKFTIEVLDNLHGGEPRDIGDLSGGERVVVEEAIRAALACYVNRSSRQPCRTLWRDEADGGLSYSNGERYILMLRRLRELSGAEQVVFITHRPDLAAMADAVVTVADGAVQSITRSAA